MYALEAIIELGCECEEVNIVHTHYGLDYLAAAHTDIALL